MWGPPEEHNPSVILAFVSLFCFCMFVSRNECVGGWERFRVQAALIPPFRREGALTSGGVVWATSRRLCSPAACQKELLMWSFFDGVWEHWQGLFSQRLFDCQKLGQGIQGRVFFLFKVSDNTERIMYLQGRQWHSVSSPPLYAFVLFLSLSPSIPLTHFLCLRVCVCACLCFVQKGGSDGSFKKGSLEELQELLNRCRRELQQAHDE